MIGLFVGREPALSVRDVGEEDGRKRGFCTKVSERGMGDVGTENGRMQSILRRKRNGGWEDADRLSHSNGTEDGR